VGDGSGMPYWRNLPPVESIERIEILSSAGSAIYGARATGGVINIITRQDFSGGRAVVNYQTPLNAIHPQRNASLNYGLPLKWGLGLRLGASYTDREPADAYEGRASESLLRWRQLARERQPSRLYTTVANNPMQSTSSIIGATPNIRAGNTVNIFSTVPDMP